MTQNLFKQTEIGRIPKEWERIILDFKISDLEIESE